MFTEIIRLDTVDSTNSRLKRLAEEGAREGTVLIADGQSAGRGTGTRSFFSPPGEGLYLSVLLRPEAELSDVLTLTGWAAAAVREGVEAACGAPCRIKWLNDIYLNGKKVCGILAELSPAMDYVVLGIGINVSQTALCFARQGLGGIATSLTAEGYPVSREALEQSVLGALEKMYRAFPREKGAYLAAYRARCLTPGRRVSHGVAGQGIALAVDENFALVIETESGRSTVSSGTVNLM